MNSAEVLTTAEFFQTRTGLWVDPDIGRLIGFGHEGPENFVELAYADLTEKTNELDLFGRGNLTKETVLEPIRERISAQWGGKEGKLLNDGEVNLFPVYEQGEPFCLLKLRWIQNDEGWFLRLDPPSKRHFWHTGQRVFYGIDR